MAWYKNIFKKEDPDQLRISDDQLTHINFGGVLISIDGELKFEKNDNDLKVATTYACIDARADACSQAKWIVQQLDGDAWVDSTNDELNSIVATPNKELGLNASNFTYKMTAAYALTGNGVAQIVRGSGGEPLELIVYPESKIKPKFVKGKKVWVLKGGKGVKDQYLDQADVVEIMQPDPTKTWQALDPRKSVKLSSDSDFAAATFQRATLKNAAIPSGIINAPNADTKDFELIQDQMRGMYSGESNARKLALFNIAEFEWIPLNMNGNEADFIETRKFYREEICAVYRVPPVVVGFLENATLANLEAGENMFWTGSVVPSLNKLAEAWSTFANDNFDGGQYRVIYTVDHPALVRVFAERVKTAKVLSDMGVPVEQINQLLDLGILEYDGWDLSSAIKTVALPSGQS